MSSFLLGKGSARRKRRDDFGSAIGMSGQLEVGGRSQGRLERRRDRDWFAITLQTGTRYKVALKGKSLSDPHLRLRDSQGRILADIDDSPKGLNPIVRFEVLQGGRYYLCLLYTSDAADD